jgi:hypothetical protein
MALRCECRLAVATEAAGNPVTSAFFRDDPWLRKAFPTWSPPNHATSAATVPFMSGFSSPRILGGLALHNKENDTYTPLPEFDVVTRDPTNSSNCGCASTVLPPLLPRPRLISRSLTQCRFVAMPFDSTVQLYPSILNF